MRQAILDEIRRIAVANNGIPPGSNAFVKATGIPDHKWRGVYWAKWSDALQEAGFAPNQWQTRLDDATILSQLAGIVRSRGQFPSNAEFDLIRRNDSSIPSANAIKRHFPGRPALLAALRKHCLSEPGLSDVVPLLPIADAPTHQAPRSTVAEGWVYLLKSGDHHKIGRSDQVERRLKQISIALPEAVALVHAIRTDDPSGIEAYWHNRFKDRRANGEWFRLSAADVAAFCRRKTQ